MPIRHAEILSRAEFDEAVVRLRLNISEIAKATEIPRTYLSEFRNGDRMLRPEHLNKLRDFFEERGLEFEHDGTSEADEVPAAAAPHRNLSFASVCHFPVRADLAGSAVRDILKEIERNDARICVLLAHKAQRITGWSGEPKGFEQGTETELRELFARLAANYVLFRYVTGLKDPFVPQAGESETLHAIVIDTLRESLDRAGLNAREPLSTGEQDA